MNSNANNLILGNAFGTQKRWLVWRAEIREDKPTKVPYAVSGTLASSTDPQTWSTYDAAKIASDQIGIVFTSDKLLIGVDLDHIFEKGFETPPYALDFIKRADSYTEWSPSRTGLHVYLALTEPLDLLANKKKIGKYHKDEGYECYTWGRFFTVTESSYGEAKPIRTVKPQEVLELLALLGYPWGKDAKDPFVDTREVNGNNEYTPSDFEVLEKMFLSKQGAEIKTLYHGGIEKYKNDDSAADMALVSHLVFWSGGDKAITERLWTNSPLGRREKTHKRKDYRDRTIAVAFKSAKDFYTWRKPNEKQENKEIDEIK